MGISGAWFIVESGGIDHVAAALDVKRTGRHGQQCDFPICARTLPDGRLLVVSRNCDEPVFSTRKLATVSRLGRTFSGALEEHVMFSAFTAWGKGRKAWSVQHQGDDGPLNFKTSGRPPKDVVALRDVALDRQRSEGEDSEVDHVFEVSLELARRYAGIDPRNVDADTAGTFEQLDIGFWRRCWERTFWWRLGFGFLGGLALFILALVGVMRVLVWIMEILGWR